jgi:hypothetical protein
MIAQFSSVQHRPLPEAQTVSLKDSIDSLAFEPESVSSAEGLQLLEVGKTFIGTISEMVECLSHFFRSAAP